MTDYSDEDDPFAAGQRSVAAIDKKTRSRRWPSSTVATTDGYHLVTVRGGGRSTLRPAALRASAGSTPSGEGGDLLAVLGARRPPAGLGRRHGDRASASASAAPDREAVRRPGGRARPAATGCSRRCNLLDERPVRARHGRRRLRDPSPRGAEARFRFEPFLTTRPAHYEPPPFKPSGTTWNLDAGLYVLTARPEKQGILDFVVRDVGAMALNLALLDHPQDALRAVQGSAQFPKLALEADSQYTVFLNRQPGVSAGLVLRHLPLDLREALPIVAAGPGEEVEVRLRGPRGGHPGRRGRGRQPSRRAPGRRRLGERRRGGRGDARRGGAQPGHRHAWSPPWRSSPSGCRRPPPCRRSRTPCSPGFPQYPVLQADAPQFFDLERRGSRTFLVRVDTPGLYRLETSGLLETSGTLRSRVITSLDTQESNGVGRNFLIQQYLREGDYQLTVRTRGPLRGAPRGPPRARRRCARAAALLPGLPARVTLGEGEGVLYTFGIPERADYTLRSLGLRQPSTCRLEDAEGWPLVATGRQRGLRARHSMPAATGWSSCPAPVPSRRLTVLEPVAPPLRFAGHGPHTLPLDREVEHLWLEPDGWCQAGPRHLGVRAAGSGRRCRSRSRAR